MSNIIYLERLHYDQKAISQSHHFLTCTVLAGRITRLADRKNGPLGLTTADGFICLNAVLSCLKYYLYSPVPAVSAVYLLLFSLLSALYLKKTLYVTLLKKTLSRKKNHQQQCDTDKRNTAGFFPKINYTGRKTRVGLS